MERNNDRQNIRLDTDNNKEWIIIIIIIMKRIRRQKEG